MMPIGGMRLANTEKSGWPGTKLKPAGWTSVTRMDLSQSKLRDFIRNQRQKSNYVEIAKEYNRITDEKASGTHKLKNHEYEEKLIRAKEKSGLSSELISGIGEVNGIKVSIAVMEFDFMGGSMGSVVGEKITRAIERGLEKNIPVIVVSTSGGARMHEGILSLMQMAKTSAALDKLRNKGLPFVSIPVNPTTGGVTASFAMLGDVILTEPKVLIGFAGPRVIEQTIRQKLPEGFQMSEFLLEHGMVDIIAKREDLKDTLAKILGNLI